MCIREERAPHNEDAQRFQDFGGYVFVKRCERAMKHENVGIRNQRSSEMYNATICGAHLVLPRGLNHAHRSNIRCCRYIDVLDADTCDEKGK